MKTVTFGGALFSSTSKLWSIKPFSGDSLYLPFRTTPLTALLASQIRSLLPPGRAAAGRAATSRSRVVAMVRNFFISARDGWVGGAVAAGGRTVSSLPPRMRQAPPGSLI